MNWQELKIFYQTAAGTAQASNGSAVVMLHGAGSSSQVWIKIRTMHLIAAMGHRAIAVDLPGTLLCIALWNTAFCLESYVSLIVDQVQISNPIIVIIIPPHQACKVLIC